MDGEERILKVTEDTLEWLHSLRMFENEKWEDLQRVPPVGTVAYVVNVERAKERES